MLARTCAALLLLSACATTQPRPTLEVAGSLRLANLQRAAALPWKDEGRCVVQEASQPWPVLVERCYQALEHDRIQFKDLTGKCAVASVGVGAAGVGLCVLAAPEIAVGAVIVLGTVVVAAAIAEELNAYRRRGPEASDRKASPAPQTQPAQEPLANPKPQPKQAPFRDFLPPDSLEPEERLECEPLPVPHAGEDDPHNQCADTFPPNRYPGMDVIVKRVRFDALQVGVRVLWEIKTHRFDTYPAFVQGEEIEKEFKQLSKERDAARDCGYDFVIGVSTQAHKDALLKRDSTFKIVVTGCKR